MVKKIEDLNFYELLEVSPTATSQEIHRAYERARRVYEPNSVALYSLFTTEETGVIHKRIEDAYHTLMYESHRRKYDELLRNEQHDLNMPVPATPPLRRPPAEPTMLPGLVNTTIDQLSQQSSTRPKEQVLPVSTPPPPFHAEFTGQAIKFLREQRNLSVREVADITKIGARYLELIEAEDYEKLPARAYLRGFLTSYAKALGYDPERVMADYLKRYEAATNQQKQK